MIRTVTMTDGFTLRKRMKMIWSRLTGALERIDCHHSQNAVQMNPKIRIAMMPMMNRMMRLKSNDMPFYLLVSCGAPSVASATTTLIAPIRTATFGLPIRIATMAMMNRPMSTKDMSPCIPVPYGSPSAARRDEHDGTVDV